MLAEADLFPEPMNAFWNMVKGSTLYVGGKKLWSCTKGRREQVVRVLHLKAGRETDGEKNIMLLRRMEEEWTHIVLKTRNSKTISGCFEAKIGGDQEKLGNFAPIKDEVFCQGKNTVINWGLFPVGGKFELWVIAPNVLSASGYVRHHILNKERFHL